MSAHGQVGRRSEWCLAVPKGQMAQVRPGTLAHGTAVALLSVGALWAALCWVVSLRTPSWLSSVLYEVRGRGLVGIVLDPTEFHSDDFVVVLGVYRRWDPRTRYWDSSLGDFGFGVADTVAKNGRTKLLHYVRFPLWVLPGALAVYPVCSLLRGPLLRWRRRANGLCVCCGYNLTGNISGVCPECGEAIHSHERAHRRAVVITAGLAICLLAAAVGVERDAVGEVPLENVYLLCSPCGLPPKETAWLINNCRASSLSREELLTTFAATFAHGEGLDEYCLECAEALLDEAGK